MSTILLVNSAIKINYKALLPVCMKYTAQDGSRVANVAQDKAKSYICHEILIKSCILSYKQSGNVLMFIVALTH